MVNQDNLNLDNQDTVNNNGDKYVTFLSWHLFIW
jgi:hypothetical protein